MQLIVFWFVVFKYLPYWFIVFEHLLVTPVILKLHCYIAKNDFVCSRKMRNESVGADGRLGFPL